MNDTDKLATGKEIILEIVRAMRANLEPLLFSTIAPNRFFVYLHPTDHERLEGIFPLLAEQARRALDEEVRSWNQKAKGSRLTRWIGGEPEASPIEPPQEAWDIRFEPDADGEMQPGDVAIASELTLPKQPEFDGTRTRRITTLRQGDTTSTREQVVASTPPAQAGTIYATLTYEDRRGPQKVQVTKNTMRQSR